MTIIENIELHWRPSSRSIPHISSLIQPCFFNLGNRIRKISTRSFQRIPLAFGTREGVCDVLAGQRSGALMAEDVADIVISRILVIGPQRRKWPHQ